jgi:hypothetical protein
MEIVVEAIGGNAINNLRRQDFPALRVWQSFCAKRDSCVADVMQNT